MNDSLQVRVFRTDSELESIRKEWMELYEHPNVDPDFFRTIGANRKEIISPYVIALYRADVLESIVVGRIERGELPLTVGYWNAGRLPITRFVVVYGGILGKLAPEHCLAIERQIAECMRTEKCDVAWLHFAPIGSPVLEIFGGASILRRDYFRESRPHWVMKLPNDVEQIYGRMSAKARKNRKYESRRFEKEFATVTVQCYESETELERVLDDAEQIARRTYQRGLGVGFEANQENRERLHLEMRNERFRGYFLYADHKPIAFFIGTLRKNVLYDNFSAYDPDYSRLSPGTYLFFKIFEHACKAGIDSIDFGFGDAWYKSQFGTEQKYEVTIGLFAPTFRGVTINALRTPVCALDRLGKASVARFAFLRSIKKRLRDRAEKRAALSAVQQ